MNLRFLFEGYKNKYQRIGTHIAFWLIYVFLYSILVSIPSLIPFTELLKQAFYTVWIDIFVTYTLIYFLLPKFLLKKRYISFVIGFLVLSFFTMLANRAITYYVYYPKYIPEVANLISFWHFDYFVSIISSLSVAIFAASIKLLKIWIKEKDKRNILQLQNLESELALLKSQINPHFIFNTLNNIDTLISIDPEKASKSIQKLSDIMRYVLYEATADYVPIEKEINYLNNYIAIYELKFDKDFIKFDNEIKNVTEIVAPMLFIPLVENAIKHGNKKIAPPGIIISLYEKQDVLFFSVKNYISPISTNKDSVGGIGINNLKRRLELLYKNKHRFETKVENDTFTAKITLL